MINTKVPCDICGKGTSTLKYDDGLYFYQCDTCGSDYANNDICKLNRSFSKCCNHDCQQGKLCPNRHISKDDSIVAYIILLILTIVVLILTS